LEHTDLIFCFSWPVRQFVLSGVDGARGAMVRGMGFPSCRVRWRRGQGDHRQRQQKQIKSTINGTHKHTESQATEQTVGMRVGKVGESGW